MKIGIKSLASAGWQKPSSDGDVCPEGMTLSPARLLGERQHPLRKLQDFFRRYSRRGAAGSDPTPVCGDATCSSAPSAVRITACSQVDCGSGSELSSYVITGSVIRMVGTFSVPGRDGNSNQPEL